MARDEQRGLWEIEIDDQELEQACAVLEQTRGVIKNYRNAIALRRDKSRALEARIRDTIGDEQFEAQGCRVRVGPYVVTIGQRSGGGFEVKPWTSVGVRSQNRAK